MKQKISILAQKIDPYVPDGIALQLAEMIVNERVVVRITRPRLTKMGDYRPPYKKESHRISINGDLNPFAFLVTFLHEFAHLYTWKIQHNLEHPHGKLWKSEFRKLLLKHVQVFPQDIQDALQSYIANPKASSCTDENLTRALSKYDENPQMLLEDIPFDVPFSLPGGRQMIKKEKLRKRFKCLDIESNREYLVSPIAEVNML
ncbi:MAG: SprT-like domain-containing protein [Bacteroidota bacterium]